MTAIKLDIENMRPFFSDPEFNEMNSKALEIYSKLESGTLPGNDYLGWLRIPSSIDSGFINSINETAEQIKSNSDAFISIGIGGSYLGAKAAIEFANHSFHNLLPVEKRGFPEIYFAGQNLSSDYFSDLLDILENKRISINVISKSGTTTEPAIAFRLFKNLIEKRYGKKEARDRVIVTTDSNKGALKTVADEEGYKSFVIPDDVGGRYSVLTPVGLLPIAVAGISIEEVIKGAKLFEDYSMSNKSNEAFLYAALRNIMYKNGKTIEILSSFHPSLHYLAEWWKQLAGESEGKELKGIFPASVDLTSDLHSMGQWIQEGQRIIFETFFTVEKSNMETIIPSNTEDNDGLNYIAKRSLDYVNEQAYRGTAMAHKDGGVPNMTITLKDRSPATLGQIFYFFEIAIAISGHLLGVNPFNQPGVEFYKKNMFKLLGKNV